MSTPQTVVNAGAGVAGPKAAGRRARRRMNVNVHDATAEVQALVRSREPIGRARLADPAVTLAELLPAGARDA